MNKTINSFYSNQVFNKTIISHTELETRARTAANKAMAEVEKTTKWFEQVKSWYYNKALATKEELTIALTAMEDAIHKAGWCHQQAFLIRYSYNHHGEAYVQKWYKHWDQPHFENYWK
jgi:hypothetical protein